MALRDTSATRARIVAAARQAFSTEGYSVVGIRAVASRAGVTSALISRYFGSKVGLFEAALLSALETAVPAGDGRDYGRMVVSMIADPDLGVDAPAMIALALGDLDARLVAERVVQARIVTPMAEWLGGADAIARAEAPFMFGTGFALLRRNLDVRSPARSRVETDMLVTEVVQRIVDEAG